MTGKSMLILGLIRYMLVVGALTTQPALATFASISGFKTAKDVCSERFAMQSLNLAAAVPDSNSQRMPQRFTTMCEAPNQSQNYVIAELTSGDLEVVDSMQIFVEMLIVESHINLSLSENLNSLITDDEKKSALTRNGHTLPSQIFVRHAIN